MGHNDIIPDDSVSVMDRPAIRPSDVDHDGYTGNHSYFVCKFMGSSIVERGDQDTFYKERERIRKMQLEKFNRQR